ncbi:MAG TPA: sulfotransferase [Rhizomicrobium sp.]|nr:sulfotransferase [Rhizomicrobium sp.]
MKKGKKGNAIDSLPRVFVIGFNRCGTRTIHWYFKANGHRAIHWDDGNLADTIFRNLGASLPLLTGYESYSVFSDMERVSREAALEAYKLYAQLDVSYPNSVFILNTRDVDGWIRSRLAAGEGRYAKKWKHHLKAKSDEELAFLWRQDWETHHRNAERYFSGRPSRFLKFNIETDRPEKINQLVPEYGLDPEKYAPRGRGGPTS